MTYNILNGGEMGIDAIVDVVKKEAPDFVTINEANTFAANGNEGLNEFAEKTGFKFSELALSGENDYHVAVLSKYPFTRVDKITPLTRACIVVEVETEFGEVSIASMHLTPYTEDQRIPEIDLIMKFQSEFRLKVMMGDMNSLSTNDNYSSTMVKDFNEMQLKKFTTDGKLRFDVIKKILSNGYVDSAVKLGKNKEWTAPTHINEFSAHSNMRLDYIFLAEILAANLKNYYVVKNPLSDKASDHYPIVVELEL